MIAELAMSDPGFSEKTTRFINEALVRASSCSQSLRSSRSIWETGTSMPSSGQTSGMVSELAVMSMLRRTHRTAVRASPAVGRRMIGAPPGKIEGLTLDSVILIRSGKLHLLVKLGKREAGIDFRQRDDGVESRVGLHREAALGLAAV